jgi:hypothetical protein
MTEKRRNFERLSKSRLNKAIKAIDLLGNLSSKNHYEYSPAEAKAMITEVKRALRNCENRFTIELSRGNQADYRDS